MFLEHKFSCHDPTVFHAVEVAEQMYDRQD